MPPAPAVPGLHTGAKTGAGSGSPFSGKRPSGLGVPGSVLAKSSDSASGQLSIGPDAPEIIKGRWSR